MGFRAIKLSYSESFRALTLSKRTTDPTSFKGFKEFLGISRDFNEFQVFSMNPKGLQGLPWDFKGSKSFQGFSRSFKSFKCVQGYSMVLIGFQGFTRVSKGFQGFLRVSSKGTS